jgi:hypothetical protein
MATLVGFNRPQPVQVQPPTAMYKSKSKGNIRICDMHDQHLVNAYRKTLTAAIAEVLKSCDDLYSMENAVENFFYEDAGSVGITLLNLREEMLRRGL